MRTKTCHQCGHALHGRADKKFCDAYCRTQFHNERKSSEMKILKDVERVLRKNRKILLMIAGKSGIVIGKDKLVELGYNFDYFTHRVKASKGLIYYFCYDRGLLPIDNNKVAVVLQDNVGR